MKKEEKTEENVIAVLTKNPLISTWNMSENLWLCDMIDYLLKTGQIKEEESAYPWHKYMVMISKK